MGRQIDGPHGSRGYNPAREDAGLKYLTTLEVAHEIGVSKQTLLNWLYAGKVPEPPRNRKGYRLWSPSRLLHLRRLIADGRVHKRTVVHTQASNRPEAVAELAREVNQFLKDAGVTPESFLKELGRLNPAFARPRRSRG
jgi:DNA-binding transcriptional MerR regulator